MSHANAFHWFRFCCVVSAQKSMEKANLANLCRWYFTALNCRWSLRHHCQFTPDIRNNIHATNSKWQPHHFAAFFLALFRVHLHFKMTRRHKGHTIYSAQNACRISSYGQPCAPLNRHNDETELNTQMTMAQCTTVAIISRFTGPLFWLLNRKWLRDKLLKLHTECHGICRNGSFAMLSGNGIQHSLNRTHTHIMPE